MGNFVNNILKKIPFAFTKNLKQGNEVAAILRKVLDREDAAIVDVGCHKGEVLKMALKVAPRGDHYAFEAIPRYFKRLKKEYKNYCYLHNIAVTNFVGETDFTIVKTNPALSGIKERDYPKNEKIEKIKLPTNTLDNVLIKSHNIDLIRIDVEGGEANVIDGAKRTIFTYKPHILFEHQLGAADYYNNNPVKMWDLLVNQLGMKINTLGGFLNDKKPFTKSHFQLLFDTGQETYFIAYY